jgi:hypothetical protein
MPILTPFVLTPKQHKNKKMKSNRLISLLVTAITVLVTLTLSGCSSMGDGGANNSGGNSTMGGASNSGGGGY